MMFLDMMKKEKDDNYQHLKDSLSKNITSMDRSCQQTESRDVEAEAGSGSG